MIRQTVYYSGQVQGVGFRYTACRTAEGLAVSGFVRNLADGRVELIAEGEEGEVERYLDRLAGTMRGAIRDVQSQQSSGTGEFRGFDVRF